MLVVKYKDATDPVTKRQAFEELFMEASYLPQQYGYAYRWAVNAEDILQEARIALIKAIETYNPDLSNNFEMWAERLIRKQVGREKHKEGRWIDGIGASIDTSEEQPFEDPRQTPEEKLESKESKQIATKMLQTLGIRERRVWELRFGFNDEEPLSHRQIANELGISRETIRAIVNRTSEKLNNMYATMYASAC